MNTRTHTRSGGRLSGIVAASLVLLTIGAGGGAIASAGIRSSQIVDGTVRSRDLRDGTVKVRDLDPSAKTALSGPAGPPGTEGVVQVAALTGPVSNIAESSGYYVFAGAPADVVITESHSRVTGTATASMAMSSAGSAFADVGMCFRDVLGGPVTNLVGNSFASSRFTSARATYAATASTALPPGSYQVGLCVRNNSAYPIDNSSYLNGWVMVSS